MGWLDTVKSWVTPESTTPEYWEFETPPETQAEVDVPLKYQYPKTEFQTWQPPSAQYDYPTLEAWEVEPLPKPEYGESLWDSFKSGVKGVYQEIKDVAPDVASFYTQLQGFKKPVDNTSLLARSPQPMEIPKTNYIMSTPYQRSTGGSQPTARPGIAGLSMPLILIGAGLVFFMLKRGKQ